MNQYNQHQYLYDFSDQFQRLYVESCACILNLDLWQVADFYTLGVSHNLTLAKFDSDLLRYTQAGLSEAVLDVDRMVQKVSSELYHQAEGESVTLAHDATLLFMGENEPCKNEVDNLVTELKEHLVNNKNDCISRLILAWLYFHYLHDLVAACQHFEMIAINAESQDVTLATMALRYHARCLALQGLYSKAYYSQHHAIQLMDTGDEQLEYELVQYAIHDDESVMQWEPKIKNFIQKTTFNYLICQSNGLINEVPDIDRLLARFHQAKLEEIRDLVWRDWNREQPYELRLLMERHLETTHLESALSKNLELLSYQPYVVLFHTDKIKSKVLQSLNIKTQSVYKSLDSSLEDKIRLKTQSFAWINKIGVVMIYMTTIALLACVFLYLGNAVLKLFFMEQVISWSEWLPALLIVAICTVVMGGFFAYFRSSEVKKMMAERQLLSAVLLEVG